VVPCIGFPIGVFPTRVHLPVIRCKLSQFGGPCSGSHRVGPLRVSFGVPLCRHQSGSPVGFPLSGNHFRGSLRLSLLACHFEGSLTEISSQLPLSGPSPGSPSAVSSRQSSLGGPLSFVRSRRIPSGILIQKAPLAVPPVLLHSGYPPGCHIGSSPGFPQGFTSRGPPCFPYRVPPMVPNCFRRGLIQGSPVLTHRVFRNGIPPSFPPAWPPWRFLPLYLPLVRPVETHRVSSGRHPRGPPVISPHVPSRGSP
jgi:hypothetical protein